MNKVVLDTSAFIAFAKGEPGAERVKPLLNRSLLLSVNFSVVVQKLFREGMPLNKAEQYVLQFISEIIPFDAELASRAASFDPKRQFGLSLGDRACLALAQQRGLTVVTANLAWAKLDFGIQVEAIR